MTVTATPYGQAILALGTGDWDFSSATLKCMIVTASYTPDIDAHDFRADITNEVSGDGYTTLGETLTTVTWTYDSANNRCVLGADALVWSTVTFTAGRYGIIYQNVGSAATDRLLGYVDFGADQSPAAVDFTLDWSTNGILRVSIV